MDLIIYNSPSYPPSPSRTCRRKNGIIYNSLGQERFWHCKLPIQTGRVFQDNVDSILTCEKRVFDLKSSLFELTKVPFERQKILGLVKGRLPPDQIRM